MSPPSSVEKLRIFATRRARGSGTTKRHVALGATLVFLAILTGATWHLQNNARGELAQNDQIGDPIRVKFGGEKNSSFDVREGKLWPEMKGYPDWSKVTSKNTGSCESAWGNGFSNIFVIYGNPPKISSKTIFSEKQSFPSPTEPSEDQITDWVVEKKKDKPDAESNLNVDLSKESAKVEVEPSWIRCRKNPTLRTSICEGTNLVMDNTKVFMSQGGEEIESVLGRTDEEELPRIDAGAFQVLGKTQEDKKDGSLVSDDVAENLYSPASNGAGSGAFWKNLLVGLQKTQETSCGTVFERPMLLVARFEYVNVYHTTTDWESSVRTCKLLGLRYRPGVIFLDGHAKGLLDPVWSTLFDGVYFAKHFKGNVCFRHLIIVPFGYSSPIFQTHKGWLGPLGICSAGFPKSLEKDDGEDEGKEDENGIILRTTTSSEERSKTPRSIEFAETFIRSFGIDLSAPSYREMFEKGQKSLNRNPPFQPKAMRVLFVRREFFLAHPRSKTGPVERMNEKKLYEGLQSWAVKRAGVNNFQELEEEELRTRDPRALAQAVRNLTSHEIDSSFMTGTTEGKTEGLSDNSNRRALHSEKNGENGENGENKVYVINGELAHFPFHEQLEMAYRIDVWLGVHGAGLTQLQFVRPGTHVVEIQTSYADTQYSLLSQFRGLPYHQIQTGHDPNVKEVTDLLESIASDFFS